MLCQNCRQISFYPAWATPDWNEFLKASISHISDEKFQRSLFCILHPSLKSLRKSNDERCHCCMMIWHFCFEKWEGLSEALEDESPVILHIELASDEEWFSTWVPRNGAKVCVSCRGHNSGNWHFLDLNGNFLTQFLTVQPAS